MTCTLVTSCHVVSAGAVPRRRAAIDRSSRTTSRSSARRRRRLDRRERRRHPRAMRTGSRGGRASRTADRQHALNKGFARARGDVLGWLASDDDAPARRGQLVSSRSSQRAPETLLVYGEALFVDERRRRAFPARTAAVRRRGDGSRVREHRRPAGLALSPPRVGARRAARRGRALPLRLRVRAARRPHGIVRTIPDRLALYRVHAESKSGGASLLKARDYVRFAERSRGLTLPGASVGERVPRGRRLLLRRRRALRRASRYCSGRCASDPRVAARGCWRGRSRGRDAVVMRIGIDATSVAPEGRASRACSAARCDALRDARTARARRLRTSSGAVRRTSTRTS